jgi:hypothetical protein
MSDLTLDQKQNRLGNLLLAGNLYKSHQISKSINTLVGGQNQLLRQNREQHQQTMGVLRNTESIVNSQLRIITEVEKRKILKNIFFEINEEVEELEKSKKLTDVEKFCKYSTLLNLLENSKIDPSITEDFEEKKYIKDSIKKLKEQDENIRNNLSASDKKDLEEIYEILSNNEEYEIYKLKQHKDYVLGEISQKLKDYYKKLMKIHNGVGLLGFIKSHTDSKYTKEYIIENKKIFKVDDEGVRFESIFSSHYRNDKDNEEDFFMLRLGISSLKLIFLNPQSDDDINEFRYKYNSIPEEKKYRSNRYINRWVKEKLKLGEFYKEIGLLDETLYADAATDFIKVIIDGEKAEFDGVISQYWKDPVSTLTSVFKKTINREKMGLTLFKKTRGNNIDDVFLDLANRYNKVIKHLNKYAENAFMNAFPEEEEKSKVIEKKIKKLEETVEEERSKVLVLTKKHPFVATILSNRLQD